MKLPPFDYRAPRSMDEVLSLLAEHGGDAKVIAGGQSLVPLLALRMARPAVVVDIGRVPGLGELEVDDGTVVAGAMTREHAAETSPLVRQHVPLLADAMPLIGHPAIRCRGTVGGTIAHADPAAEAPAVALALDAEIVARSAARGTRTIAAAEFFQGFLTTALEEDEAVTQVRFPIAAPRTGGCFDEVARRHGDFAIAGVATQVRLDEHGRIEDARIVLIGVSDVPLRRSKAEQLLRGQVPTAAVFDAAADAAAADLAPAPDLHGSSAYRVHLARVVVRRALDKAAQRAETA
ncbi:FAD binding domain-containing protein [Leekyejoonella antrihumi]|uniref:Xanthine dehydrogenase family protein subunit M n=1 Tax=Leekyejoonella antrihumi TaxID=1660198 RepID=A0A563DW85_9MICO|nr:FAD binding domain-containing protein [Leekyejoonella antrihumi]TWP34548.1 xanthine dehydrogenase family protein subunit M [Leekyejoonella antrihumi]